MLEPASKCRAVSRRRAWHVCMAVLCKLVILLSVFQAPVDISGKAASEHETTHLCKVAELRCSTRASHRQAVATIAAHWLPFPASASQSRHQHAGAFAILPAGHTWSNGLRAPLRL